MEWTKELKFVVEEDLRKVRYGGYMNEFEEWVEYTRGRVIFFTKQGKSMESINNIIDFDLSEIFKRDFTLKKWIQDIIIENLAVSDMYAVEGVKLRDD